MCSTFAPSSGYKRPKPQFRFKAMAIKQMRGSFHCTETSAPSQAIIHKSTWLEKCFYTSYSALQCLVKQSKPHVIISPGVYRLSQTSPDHPDPTLGISVGWICRKQSHVWIYLLKLSYGCMPHLCEGGPACLMRTKSSPCIPSGSAPAGPVPGTICLPCADPEKATRRAKGGGGGSSSCI